MLKQFTYTYDSTAATPTSNWFPMNIAGYDTVALTIVANAGWIGTISFWGGAGADQLSEALWSLNDSDDASLVSQVETYSGSTPSYFSKNFRGSVAGLAEFGVYFADPTTNVSAQGIITIKVGFYSSAK
jgi:hypothetical protein